MRSPFAPEKTLVWLHLSDLHAGTPRIAWDVHRVLQTLCADLEQMEAVHGLRPDLIFFTGDAAFGQIGNGVGETIAEQFQYAQTFLEGVRNGFSLPVPHDSVFLVPGNHDVNRTMIFNPNISSPDVSASNVALSGGDALEHRTDADAVSAMIQSGGAVWQSYMQRLADYKRFLEQNGYASLLSDPDRLLYAVTRQMKGVKIGIAGFNSAWSCGHDNEASSLWLGGKGQMNRLLPELGGTDLSIALLHHPIHWFAAQEGSDLVQAMEQDFTFCLHGQEPQGWIDARPNGHTRIAAAACYDRLHRETGYNFVRLDLETGRGEVWLRWYDRYAGAWAPHIIYNKTDDDGRCPLNHLRWRPSPAPKPVDPKPVDPATAPNLKPAATEERAAPQAVNAGSLSSNQLTSSLPPIDPGIRTSSLRQPALPSFSRERRVKAFFAGVVLLGICFFALRRRQNNIIPVEVAPPDENVTNPLAFCSYTIEDWMREVVRRFRQMHPECPDGLVPYGSRDGKQYILYQQKIKVAGRGGINYIAQGRPLLYCPADPYWFGKLDEDWMHLPNRPPESSPHIVSTRQNILNSRLVLIVRGSPAKYEDAIRQNYQNNTWLWLYNFAKSGGGKIAMADPTKTHSGIGTLVLMLEGYRRDHHPKATSTDPGFLEFMQTIAGAVLPEEENTTGTLVQRFATDNPGGASIAIGYEADVLQQLKANPGSGLQVIYPDPTLEIHFSAAVLQGDWTKQNQQIAQDFIAFLATPEMRTLALKYGLRPENASEADLQKAVGESLFTNGGFRVDAHTISLDRGSSNTNDSIMNDLPFQWKKIMDARPSKLGGGSNVGK